MGVGHASADRTGQRPRRNYPAIWRSDWAPRSLRCAAGASVIPSWALLAFEPNRVAAGADVSRRPRSIAWWRQPGAPGPKRLPGGWPRRWGLVPQPFTESGRNTVCSRIGWNISSSAPTPSLRPGWRTLSAFNLDPAERALVLCVDEKSQIQALNRTAPLLQLRPGIPAQMSHDNRCNGTSVCSPRWRWPAAKFTGAAIGNIVIRSLLPFSTIALRYRRRELHLICDNYGTHKHPAAALWLFRHPNFHLHFTPTASPGWI
jgi:hypothetical protein